LGFHGKVLVVGGLQGWLLFTGVLEASPMSIGASASNLQEGPDAGQGQANQQRW